MYRMLDQEILIQYLTQSIENNRKEIYKNIKTLCNLEFDRLVREINEDVKLINRIQNDTD